MLAQRCPLLNIFINVTNLSLYLWILSAPEVPSIVQAYSKRSDSITVEFAEVSGATAYILRAENNDGFFSESVVYGSPGIILNLRAYTDYTLSVMSRNIGGHSQPSCPVQVRTGRLRMNSVSGFLSQMGQISYISKCCTFPVQPYQILSCSCVLWYCQLLYKCLVCTYCIIYLYLLYNLFTVKIKDKTVH